MKFNDIHVFCAINDNYIVGGSSLIASALSNSDALDKLHFHVIHYKNCLNKQNKDNINKLKNIKDCFITFDVFDKTLPHEIKTRYHNEIFMKFFAFELFPDLDKIIWLDSDIIIQKSLFSLYRRDLTDKAFASVDHGYFAKEITGGFRNSRFMSAGVVLFNCEYMRKNQTADRLFKTAAQFDYDRDFGKSSIGYEDEYALTYGIEEHNVDHLPYKYNSIPGFFKTADSDDCVILHYVGHKKPWHESYDKNSKYYKIWRRYYEMAINC